MRIQLIIILFLITKLVYAQRIPAYDSISTPQQDYPCVVQALEDGTLLMAAVNRPWLWNGKGSLVLVRMDIEGQPMYHKTLELPDMGINNAGGIFKTGENQYTIFCTFDTTTPTFNNKPTHFGYVQTDTLFNFTFNQIVQVPFSPTATLTGVYDIKVKRIGNGNNYFARLGLYDNSPGYHSPFIFNATVSLEIASINILPDTLRRYKNYVGNVNQLSYTTIFPLDFLIDDNYRFALFLDKWSYSTGSEMSFIQPIDSIYYSIFSHEAIQSQDTLKVYDFKIEREWRTNILFYKNRFILIGGTGSCRENFDLIDTLYKNNPGQSGLTLLVLDTTLIKTQYNHPFEYPYPYRFTFVEDIREAFYDTIDDGINMYRLYGDLYSSAFMQCLDYWDENKIYYGRQIGDVVNVQRRYDSFPSLLLISQFDSTLNKTWERRIPARNREGIVSVNATQDGGVILTTRSSPGPLNDPQFPGMQVHAFDISVYKINQYGVITSVKQGNSLAIQHNYTLYPNPAVNQIYIQGNKPVSAIQIWDEQGKRYAVDWEKTIQKANINHLPTGIYFIQLLNEANKLLQVIRFVKE